MSDKENKPNDDEELDVLIFHPAKSLKTVNLLTEEEEKDNEEALKAMKEAFGK